MIDLDNIKNMILPAIESNDCYLDDIAFEKDSGEMYLRVYVELNEGLLDMDTCVKVSEAISEILDDKDPIDEEYYLEVSSPGIEKPLTSLDKIIESIDKYVFVQFKDPTQGMNELEGFIKEVNDNDITFEYLVKNIKKKIVINYSNIKFIRLAVKF